MLRCSSIVICAISCCLADVNSSQPTSLNASWIRSLFQEAERAFDMEPSANVRCKNDFQRYRVHLQNQTVWAVRMSESSEWPTVGLLAGMTEHMGNYEECLMVTSGDLRGRYCSVNALYEFSANPGSAYGTSVEYAAVEEASVWDTLQMYQRNPIRRNRQRVSWAMCIPSSCSHTDLHTSLSRLLSPLFERSKLNITVNLQPTLCSLRNSSTVSLGFYSVSIFLAAVVALGICSTVYDSIASTDGCKEKDKSTLLVLFEDFSLRRNFDKLANLSRAEELPCGHLMKIVYMCIIIFGHRRLFVNQMPMFNPEGGELSIYPSSITLANLTVVDTFFFCTGLITFYYGLMPMKKLGSSFVARSLITRWLRIIPMFCIIELFVIYVLPHLNDGPLWNQKLLPQSENCKVSFWANFFCLSNFINADRQCLIISWYVAVDIQLAIIGCFLLFIISKNDKLGICLLAATFAAASVVTFAVVYGNRYNGLLLIFYDFQKNLFEQDEFNYFYSSFYPRIPPYLTGFLTAYVTRKLRKRKYTFSNMAKVSSIAAGFGFKVLVMVYGLQFYKLGRGYSRVENGVYAATGRWLYVLFEAAIATIGFTSGLGKLDAMLNWKMFIPFGRLTYCVFLVNTLIQLFHTSSQRTTIESTSLVNEVWWTTADITLSYLFGFLLHLFLEAPISNLSKRLTQNLFSSKTSSKDESKKTAFSAVGKSKTEELSVGKEKTELPPTGNDNESFEKNEKV